MPKLEKYFYGNGGPIIMVQIENEYGSFGKDAAYKNWMRDEILKYTKDKTLIFTTDGFWLNPVSYGKIQDVYATVDFGTNVTVAAGWVAMRGVEPVGPLVNSEFYPGWLTHWGEVAQGVATEDVVRHLQEMLEANASVNLYVFYGGTNFGFTSGANYNGDVYQPQLTSYDYDAPLTEAGDPTEKYFAIRELIGKYLPLPSLPLPTVSPKAAYGTVAVKPVLPLLQWENNELAKRAIYSDTPMTFEALDQFSGLVLYETTLSVAKTATLKVTQLHDRALVYLDKVLLGVLERALNRYTLSLTGELGSKLQILVENQGRINFGPVTNEYKGIIGSVLWGASNLTSWTNIGYPLETVKITPGSSAFAERTVGELINGPVAYEGLFDIPDGKDIIDTYLDPTGWGKGVAYVNGHNLGRYWPARGPQVTLYVPGVYLKRNGNKLLLVEYETAPAEVFVKFTDVPYLDKEPTVN